ncbi:MAG: polysaccharide deacetylase family protein [Desulfovibrionaceae bacterium]|nr:polysaccharide deacetylase family protein [Desulfovibrionaceae bacterium]
MQSLPVLMYHYVSRWPSATAVTPEHFEDQCRGMAENGWRGISLEEAEAFFLRGERLPPRSVLITFDDGYLDNYVHAWPVLQQYGHCGVICVVTDRLDTAPLLRQTARNGSDRSVSDAVDFPMRPDTLGLLQRQDLFCSWREIRAMIDSGVIAVAGHSARHLAVWKGPEIEKIRGGSPADQFYHPKSHENTFYLVDGPRIWGMPRFRERPALHSRAFLPSNEMIDVISHLVPQNDAEALAFFADEKAVADLKHRTEALKSWGRMETDEERCRRVETEMRLCRETLHRELGSAPGAFCWPWGSGSDLARKTGTDLGFSNFWTTEMGANPPGQAAAIRRFKVRDRGWDWLKLRLKLYSHTLTAGLYASCRI